MVVGTFLNSPLSPHPVLLRSYLSPIFIHPSYLKKLCRKIQSFMLRDKESERNSHKKKLSTVALVYFLWIIWQFLPISSNLGRIIWVLEQIKFPFAFVRSLCYSIWISEYKIQMTEKSWQGYDTFYWFLLKDIYSMNMALHSLQQLDSCFLLLLHLQRCTCTEPQRFLA